MSKLKKGCLAAVIILVVIVGFGWWFVWSMLHPPKLANLAPADVVEFQSIDPLNMIGLEVGPLTIWEGVSQRYTRAVGGARIKSISEKFKELLGVEEEKEGDDFWKNQIKSWFSREMAQAVRVEAQEDGDRVQFLLLIGSRSRGKADAAIKAIFKEKAQDIYNIVKYAFLTSRYRFLDSWSDNPTLVTVNHNGINIYCPTPAAELGGNVPCLASVKGALAIAYVPDTRFAAGSKPQGMEFAQEYLKLVIDINKSGGNGSLAQTSFYKHYSSKVPSDYIVYRIMNFAPLAQRAKARDEAAGKDPNVTGWMTPYGPKLIENLTMFDGVLLTLRFDDLSPKLRLSLLLNKPEGQPNPKRFGGMEPVEHEIAKLLNTPESMMFFSAAHVGDSSRLFNEVMTDPQYVGADSVGQWSEFKLTMAQGYGIDVDKITEVLGDEMGVSLININAPNPDSNSPIPVPHLVGAVKVTDPARAQQMVVDIAEAMRFIVIPESRITRVTIDPTGANPKYQGLSPAFAIRDNYLVFASVASDLESFLTGKNGALTGKQTNVQLELNMEPIMKKTLGWFKRTSPKAGDIVGDLEPLTQDAFNFFSNVSARITFEDDEVAAEFGIDMNAKAIKDYDWEKLADKVFDLIRESRGE